MKQRVVPARACMHGMTVRGLVSVDWAASAATREHRTEVVLSDYAGVTFVIRGGRSVITSSTPKTMR